MSSHAKRALLLILAGVLAYLPVLHAGFIWDDDATLTANALIRAPDGLYRFWFTTQPADYWPVSSSTLWAEWRLWGMHAAGYHCTNVMLHLGSCLLLWATLRRLRIPGAYLAALLFAVHPVNVESVAWIAQRKNLLAMLFFLASIYFYARPRGKPLTPGPPAYALSLAAFVLALLSKGSVAPLPLVLLGLILWNRRPDRDDLRRLAAFFAAAVIFAGVNVWFERHGSADALRPVGAVDRILGAGAAIWFYVGKALLPVKLTLVYPQWHLHASDAPDWIPLLGAVAFTAALWRAPRLRPVLFAWGYYCIMLAPALGLTDVTFMQYSLVADHYQHLALIAVVALAAWVQKAMWTSPPLWGALVGVLGVCTFLQCRMYRDNDTLYRTMLARDPHSWLAENNLGILADQAGHPEAAMKDYAAALRFNPDFAGAHYNLGRLLAQRRNFAAAAREFGAAVHSKPDFGQAAVDWGSALMQSGDLPGAIARYQEALRLVPTDPHAHDYFGIALAQSGRLREAAQQFDAALRLQPDYPEARQNLADVLRALGKP